MKHVLPDDDNGSRVIITTRSEKVGASYKDSSFDHVHKLEPLSKAISWDIFCRISFQRNLEFHCPPELEELSLRFTRMCDDMPLTVVVVASFLSMKEKLISGWRKVFDSNHYQLQPNTELVNVTKILALSFRDLPSHLRLCFLYFSIFPENSLISNDKLYKLWIVEGFVQQHRGLTLEEIVEQY
ncbi:disease resistance protein RPM1-like [Humulus lupulus]|uniref:disease resistance protein RPM1-like n=1 Tax=Humulus lupulus TaxID=3486 RepID=UPI002B40D2D1|nr:disease resistance protein RPM1-like [Humulus lupulus]